MRAKGDLPVKACARCGLPMTWRKRWARTWAEVKYCSERCRAARTRENADTARPIPPSAVAKVRG